MCKVSALKAKCRGGWREFRAQNTRTRKPSTLRASKGRMQKNYLAEILIASAFAFAAIVPSYVGASVFIATAGLIAWFKWLEWRVPSDYSQALEDIRVLKAHTEKLILSRGTR